MGSESDRLDCVIKQYILKCVLKRVNTGFSSSSTEKFQTQRLKTGNFLSPCFYLFLPYMSWLPLFLLVLISTSFNGDSCRLDGSLRSLKTGFVAISLQFLSRSCLPATDIIPNTVFFPSFIQVSFKKSQPLFCFVICC